jgi:hypothetical protein
LDLVEKLLNESFGDHKETKIRAHSDKKGVSKFFNRIILKKFDFWGHRVTDEYVRFFKKPLEELSYKIEEAKKLSCEAYN